MSGGAGTVTLERPATVTLANGAKITSNMSVEERSAAIRGSMGLAPVERPKAEGFAYSGPPINYRDQQATMRQAPTPTAPREDGTVADAPHAGMIAPSPEELERGNSGNNNLAEFEREMREKGAMLPAPIEDGRFQRDPRTGHVVDTAALEKCHELYRSIKDPAEREAARREYHETLDAIYRGELQLADMEGSDAPRVEQPRDASGRFAPSQPTGEPGWKSHIEDGQWVDIGRLTTVDTHGYTIPRYRDDQRLNISTFELLKSARAAGITQEQVNAVFHQDAIKNGWRKA